MSDGEIRKLQFDENKIEIVDNEFEGKTTKRVNYKVTDLDRPDEGEKTLSMALNTANIINAKIERGKNTLEIQRIGSGKRTRYNISAI